MKTLIALLLTSAVAFGQTVSPAARNGSNITNPAFRNAVLSGSNVDGTELGYLDGVSSGIQAQLNAKLAASQVASGTITAKTGDLDFNNISGGLARSAELKRQSGDPQKINGWHMAGWAHSKTYLKTLLIGNSFVTGPIDQIGKVWGEKYATGSVIGVQQIPVSTGAYTTLTGSAGFGPGTAEGQTIVPQENGYLNIPAGSTATCSMVGTHAWVSYVVESGGGSLLVEESTNGGSSWSTLTTLNCSGSTAYQNYKATPGARLLRSIRLTSSTAACRVGYLGVLGQSTYITINTGGATDPDQFNTTKQLSGTIENWWGAAGYDPDLVIISYAHNGALHADWNTMMARILASCPNAQIIITGVNAYDGSYNPASPDAGLWDRWNDGGYWDLRNEAVRTWAVDRPRVAWIDVGKAMPSLTDTDSSGLGDIIEVGATTTNTDMHLGPLGKQMKNAIVWEAMRPWVFLNVPKSSAVPSKKEVFDQAGTSYLQTVTSDISVTSDTTPVSGAGAGAFWFQGIQKQGLYALDGYLIIESTNTIGFKSFFDAWNGNLIDVSYLYMRGVSVGSIVTDGSSAGAPIPAAAWDVATSTVRVHVKGIYKCNGGTGPNFDGGIALNFSQETSSATATKLKAGSWMRLSLPNSSSALGGNAASDHRPYIQGYPAPATQILTLTGNAVANETVVVGARTYTWKSSLSAVDQILVGATAEASINNLVATINGSYGAAGTICGTGTWINRDFWAEKTSPTTMKITSRMMGVNGNSLATTEAMTNASWPATSTSNGAD